MAHGVQCLLLGEGDLHNPTDWAGRSEATSSRLTGSRSVRHLVSTGRLAWKAGDSINLEHIASGMWGMLRTS